MKLRKWLIYIIPIVFLVISIGVMAGGSFLKQPLGKDDRLLEAIKNLEDDINKKEWKQAGNKIDYAQKAWSKIVNRIQFSVEREYMFQISGALSRIKGGIEVEDDKATMEEIYFFYDLWESLGA
jgi:hypothetical protein